MTQDDGTTDEATEAARTADGHAPSRRSLLGWGGAGLALGAAAAGGAVGAGPRRRRRRAGRATAGAAVAFHGAHQAGIATAVQDRLHFAAFDVTTDDRAELVAAAQGLDRGRAAR